MNPNFKLSTVIYIYMYMYLYVLNLFIETSMQTNVVHFEIKSTYVAVVVSENCFFSVNVLLLKHNFFTFFTIID
jgi:hypothetical protein